MPSRCASGFDRAVHYRRGDGSLRANKHSRPPPGQSFTPTAPFNDFSGLCERGHRYFEVYCPSGLEIYNKLELDRLLDRHLTWFFAL
jgi:hypothetical protein